MSISARRRPRHRSRACQGARRAGGSVVLPAFQQTVHDRRRRASLRQSSVAPVRDALLVGDRQCRRRAGRIGPALSVRRGLFGSVRALDGGVLAGRHAQAARLPDRFRHRARQHPGRVVCRRCCAAIKYGGDEGPRRSSSAAPRSSSAIGSTFRTAGSSRDQCCRRWPSSRCCRTGSCAQIHHG